MGIERPYKCGMESGWESMDSNHYLYKDIMNLRKEIEGRMGTKFPTFTPKKFKCGPAIPSRPGSFLVDVGGPKMLKVGVEKVHNIAQKGQVVLDDCCAIIILLVLFD